jgi:hypothetical protein
MMENCRGERMRGAVSGPHRLGESNFSIQLGSVTYLTGNDTQSCPVCRSGGVPVVGSPSNPGTGTCDRGARNRMAVHHRPDTACASERFVA